MAQAYADSIFIGIDYHAESIETARKRAEDAGVAGRVTFEIAEAKNFSGSDYELICFMDCFHDLGNPLGRQNMPGEPWLRMAQCYWSSHSRATMSSTTSTRRPPILRGLCRYMHAHLALAGSRARIRRPSG
jgi:cyclopropane fatty-acyl-phospholipid synthase-like methyltransferase